MLYLIQIFKPVRGRLQELFPGGRHVSWRICSISKDWGRWLGTTLKVNPHPYPRPRCYMTYQWKNCFSQLWNLKRYSQIILLCMYFKIENIFVVKWKWVTSILKVKIYRFIMLNLISYSYIVDMLIVQEITG